LVIQDRLTRGFFAGLAGGIAMNVINLTSFYAGIAELRFLDWAAYTIYGTKPQNFAETVFAQGAQLIFVGILGIIFAYLIPVLTSRNYLLRGWLYGAIIWFSLYGISMLFKIEATTPLRLGTVATDLVGASVFGLVLAVALHR
jgi:hypothetical protein